MVAVVVGYLLLSPVSLPTPQVASGADYNQRPDPKAGTTVHIYRSARILS